MDLLTSKDADSDTGSSQSSESTIDVDVSGPIVVPCKPQHVTCESQHPTNLNIVEEYPKGYPLLAAFQSSEPSFSIYRSFDYLHARVILNMQDELRVLEKRLGDLDNNDSNSSSEDTNKCVGSRDADVRRAIVEGKPSQRAVLLSDICDKLCRYDEILQKARGMNGFQRPSKRDWGSVGRWFDGEKPLSYEAEGEFIRKKEDLITLRQGREWAGFDGWVESSIKLLPKRLGRVSFFNPGIYQYRY
jgi:hypothetical protein